MPPALAQIVGKYSLTDTIFRWESVVCVAVEIVMVGFAVWLFAPGEGRARGMNTVDVAVDSGEPASPSMPSAFGERLEHSPVLLLPIVLLGFAYLIRAVALVRASSMSEALNALDFNNINLFLLMLGGAASLDAGVANARLPSCNAVVTWGVLLQFPFYAGIFGIS